MGSFAELATDPGTTMDRLALALAAEFRPVDEPEALATLDALGADVRDATSAAAGDPRLEAAACARVLGDVHGFTGDRREYDRPENSMLDVVLRRRRGLPILLSVVYVEAARRAGVDLRGVGLPGHFVVAHFGATPPLLLDPFGGGRRIELTGAVAPWTPPEIAMRMLNNLVGAFERRGNLSAALRAAELRLALPAQPPWRETLRAELALLRARLN